jgi:ribonuclease Z
LKTFELSGYSKTLYIYGPRGIKKHMKNLFLAFGGIKNYKIEIKEVSGKFFEDFDFYLEAKSVSHRVPCNSYCFVKKDKIRIDREKLKKLNLGSGPHLAKLQQGKNIKYQGKKYLGKNLTFTEKGKKISFVFDALYEQKIISFVRNSDLLICESTFSDNEKEEAKERKHLTSKQAGQIAKKSGAKKLIITHISQRYSKDYKKILNETKSVFKNTTLAEDLDEVEVE